MPSDPALFFFSAGDTLGSPAEVKEKTITERVCDNCAGVSSPSEDSTPRAESARAAAAALHGAPVAADGGGAVAMEGQAVAEVAEGYERRSLELSRGASGLGLYVHTHLSCGLLATVSSPCMTRLWVWGREIDDQATVRGYTVAGGPGEQAGVGMGWRIVGVNGIGTADKRDVVKALSAAPGAEPIAFDFDTPLVAPEGASHLVSMMSGVDASKLLSSDDEASESGEEEQDLDELEAMVDGDLERQAGHPEPEPEPRSLGAVPKAAAPLPRRAATTDFSSGSDSDSDSVRAPPFATESIRLTGIALACVLRRILRKTIPMPRPPRQHGHHGQGKRNACARQGSVASAGRAPPHQREEETSSRWKR